MSSKSYLVVRFSAIGDCVMASHVASAIRQSKPDAHITWAGETRCLPVVDRERLVDAVVDFPRDDWESRRWSPQTWRDQLRTFARLRARNYDYGIDLQGYAKTAICLRVAKPRRRIAAFGNDSFARLLNPVAPGDPHARHRVERMVEALRVFGEYPQASEIEPIMPRPLPGEELGVDANRPLVSISSGAGAKNKQYSPERWREIAETLRQEGYRVVSLGMPSDPVIGLAPEDTLNGKLSLTQSMSVVAHSTVHLAADTGTGHMAAAYGIPFVSIFGPTDPKLFRPYSDAGVVLKRGESPDAVTVAEVLEAVQNLRIDHGRAISD